MALPRVTDWIADDLKSDSGIAMAWYERLIEYELGGIELLLKAFPEKETRYRRDLETIRKEWNGLRGLASGEDLASALDGVVTRINGLIAGIGPSDLSRARFLAFWRMAGDQVDGHGEPENDRTSESKSMEVPYDKIDEAIDLLDTKIAAKWNDSTSEVPDCLRVMFGEENIETAAKRIREIVATLRKVRQRRGFVDDEKLPRSTYANATGQGSRARVRLGVAARGAKTAPLAVALMHEGSHIIDDFTEDFAYRGTRQHYFLPAELALYNAANYEQVAQDVLVGHGQPPGAPEIERARSFTEAPRLLAARIITVKITVMWIYAGNLREGGKIHPELPPVLGLPDRRDHPDHKKLLLRPAVLGALWDCVELLNGAAQRGIELRCAAEPVRVAGNRVLLGFGDHELSEGSPGYLARRAQEKLCAWVVEAVQAPWLMSELNHFLEIFRMDPRLRPHVLRSLENRDRLLRFIARTDEIPMRTGDAPDRPQRPGGQEMPGRSERPDGQGKPDKGKDREKVDDG